MYQSVLANRILTLTLSLSGACALAIIAAQFFASGKYILIPYLAIIVAIGLVLNRFGIEPFTTRLFVASASVASAIVAQYVMIVITREINVPFGGHIARLLFVAALSVVVGAIVARLSDPAPDFSPELASLP